MSRKVNLGAVTAYAIAVKNGYKGTEAEWLASLKGADGAVGPQGPQGPQGPNGANGYTPVKGTDYFTEAEKQEFIGEIKDSAGGASPYEELSEDINLDKLVPGTYKILKGSSVSIVTGGSMSPVVNDVIVHISEHYTNSEGKERFEISGYFSFDIYGRILYSAGEGTTEGMHYYTIGWGLPNQRQEGIRQESTGGLQASNIVAGDNIGVSVDGDNIVISATGGGSASPYEELNAGSDNPIQLEQLTPGTYKILQGSYVNVGGNFCHAINDIVINIGRKYTTINGASALDITGFFAIDLTGSEPIIKYDIGPMAWDPSMHYYTINGTIANGYYEGVNQAGLTSMNLIAGDGIQLNYDEPGFIKIETAGGGAGGGGSSYIEGFNQDLYVADPDSTTDIADRGTKLFHYGCSLSNNAGELLTKLQSCSDARLKLEVYCNNIGVTYYYYLKDFDIASNNIACFKGISGINLNNGCKEALIYVQVKSGQIIIDFEAFADLGQKMKRAILEYC